MPLTRVPLGHNIGSRDGTLNKDSKLGNAIIEVEKSESLSIVKRPGLVEYQSVGTGDGLGIFAVGTHLFTIVGDQFYDNGVAKGTVDDTDEYDWIASIDQTLVFLRTKLRAMYIQSLQERF